jgi:hypothetical protein
MKRRPQFTLPTGFAVIAIPESGLFFKDGRLGSAEGLEMTTDEIILFKRRLDAEAHAKYLKDGWENGTQAKERRDYVVIGVLVQERL